MLCFWSAAPPIVCSRRCLLRAAPGVCAREGVARVSRTNPPMGLPPRRERRAEDAGRAVCACSVTCFCGIDVLLVVEFISEDLSYIVKKKKVLYVFLALKYSKVINSSVCIYLSLLSLSVNSVQICDSVSNVFNSDHQLAI